MNKKKKKKKSRYSTSWLSQIFSTDQGHNSNLQLGAGIQHDILPGVLDVLHPRGQPGDRVVKAHLLPPVTFWGLRNLGIPVGRAGLEPSDNEEQSLQ